MGRYENWMGEKTEQKQNMHTNIQRFAEKLVNGKKLTVLFFD